MPKYMAAVFGRHETARCASGNSIWFGQGLETWISIRLGEFKGLTEKRLYIERR
jgi:hypothetical protein